MMQVFQRTPVHIHEYPFAERLNPKLHDIILEKAVNRDFGATMTSWKECSDIKEFRTIADWVHKIILGLNLKDGIDGIFDLKLKELWGQYYKKGDYQIDHHHNPLSWSFVYYVNAPKGSAPLVFTSSNKKIFPKPGMLVLFPSWVYHYVPKHKCEEIRSIVSGDFFYSVDWEKEESSRESKGFRGG
tara:strand:- start:81 stop:638 length:558 start_codon:yes stop_codon:yes gene_type:complete